MTIKCFDNTDEKIILLKMLEDILAKLRHEFFNKSLFYKVTSNNTKLISYYNSTDEGYSKVIKIITKVLDKKYIVLTGKQYECKTEVELSSETLEEIIKEWFTPEFIEEKNIKELGVEILKTQILITVELLVYDKNLIIVNQPLNIKTFDIVNRSRSSFFDFLLMMAFDLSEIGKIVNYLIFDKYEKQNYTIKNAVDTFMDQIVEEDDKAREKKIEELINKK